jgi:CHAD domain-containing protein
MKSRSDKDALSRHLTLLAARLLRSRSRFLEGGLPGALHDFRVGLRRLRACLRLLRHGLPSQNLQSLRAFLKGAARDTSGLRDLDVFDELRMALPFPEPSSAGGRKWLLSLEKERRTLERRARRSLASPLFTRELSRLRKEPGLRPDRVRVEAKRLRYGLEEFGFLLPYRCEKIARKCRKVQETLGGQRDLELALQRLEKVRSRTLPGAETARSAWRRQKARGRKKSKKALRALRRALEDGRQSPGPHNL